ncbi:MAG: prepilin peptidase [Actinomycetota bacterium]
MPLAVAVVIWFLFGLVFGSFVTVLVYRVPRHESIAKPGSRCPRCGTPLRVIDNVPVVSYLIRRGRCHACGERISARYPLTELATSALFVLAALAFPEEPFVAGVIAIFFGVLLALSLIDFEHRILPNAITYPSLVIFAIAVVAGQLLGTGMSILGAGLGLLGYAGALFLIAFLYPKGMGMGDVKLVALIGLVAGSLGAAEVVVAAAAGFFSGGIVGLGVLLVRRRRGQTMPFGPFLAFGAVVGILVGPQIASWYLGLLG